MRNLVAALITLYLLRLPLMVTCGLDLPDEQSSSSSEKMTIAEARALRQHEAPWLIEQVQARTQVACHQQQANRQVAQLLLEIAENIARRANNMVCTRKRNSELINSLLGLPKVMNDAGRK